jgi:hypothetical protein
VFSKIGNNRHYISLWSVMCQILMMIIKLIVIPVGELRYAGLFIFLNSSVPSLLPLLLPSLVPHHYCDDAQFSPHWKTLRITFSHLLAVEVFSITPTCSQLPPIILNCPMCSQLLYVFSVTPTWDTCVAMENTFRVSSC